MAYIAMSSEVLQELDFAQGALGQDFLAKNIGDLLDGNTLLCLVIDGCTVTGNDRQRSATGSRRGGKPNG